MKASSFGVLSSIMCSCQVAQNPVFSVAKSGNVDVETLPNIENFLGSAARGFFLQQTISSPEGPDSLPKKEARIYKMGFSFEQNKSTRELLRRTSITEKRSKNADFQYVYPLSLSTDTKQ